MKKTNHFLKLLLPLFLLIGCGVSNEEMSNLAQRMAELDGVDMSQADEDRSSELIFKIKKLEDDIGQILDKQREISEFNKLLGLKYMDYRMWIPAAESFNQAISLTPENSRLHYYRAICFGQQAKSESEFSRKQELFSASEEDYLIALRLDPRYSSAAYGLAVLYVFEMDRPSEAANLLDGLLQTDPSNLKARMLRARLYEESGNTGLAVEMYRSVVDIGRNQQLIEAAKLRLQVLGG